MSLDRADVLGLLVDRLAVVLGVDAATISEATRYDEDLHADSLDLVEVVEGVEGALAGRGLAVHLPDADLVILRTVGETADRIAALVTEASR